MSAVNRFNRVVDIAKKIGDPDLKQALMETRKDLQQLLAENQKVRVDAAPPGVPIRNVTFVTSRPIRSARTCAPCGEEASVRLCTTYPGRQWIPALVLRQLGPLLKVRSSTA